MNVKRSLKRSWVGGASEASGAPRREQWAFNMNVKRNLKRSWVGGASEASGAPRRERWAFNVNVKRNFKRSWVGGASGAPRREQWAFNMNVKTDDFLNWFRKSLHWFALWIPNPPLLGLFAGIFLQKKRSSSISQPLSTPLRGAYWNIGATTAAPCKRRPLCQSCLFEVLPRLTSLWHLESCWTSLSADLVSSADCLSWSISSRPRTEEGPSRRSFKGGPLKEVLLEDTRT